MSASPPRNLLVIILDEWRQAALGASGADPVQTPVFDQLAAEGAHFTQAVSNYPVCSPHRAMLMSGRYPHANGVDANCNSVTTPDQQLHPSLRCWSDVLNDVGFRCGYIGKWHLDAPTERDIARDRERGRPGITWDAFTPPDRRHGFTYWDAYGSSNDHFRTLYWRTGAAEEEGREYPGWSPRHDTDSAIAFIDDPESSARPWALVVSYNPPHMPFHQVPDEWLEHYAATTPAELLNRPNVPPDCDKARGAVADYFAMVTAIDAEVGRLLTSLGDRLDDTLVVVTSDHGEMMGSHGLMGKNVWYDESLLVPLIMRHPATIPAGTNDLLVSTPDLYPTFLSLLGMVDDARARVPSDLHGRDLSAAVREPQEHEGPDVALYVSRQSPWDLDTDGRWLNSRDERGLRTREWTYVHRRTPNEDRLLFDLAADPFQREDVYQQTLRDRPEVIAHLDQQLRAELLRIDDPWASNSLSR